MESHVIHSCSKPSSRFSLQHPQTLPPWATMGHPSAQRLLHHFIHLSLHLSDLPSAPWIDRSWGRSEHLRSEPNEDHFMGSPPMEHHQSPTMVPTKKANFMGENRNGFQPPPMLDGTNPLGRFNSEPLARCCSPSPLTIGKSSRLSNRTCR